MSRKFQPFLVDFPTTTTTTTTAAIATGSRSIVRPGKLTREECTHKKSFNPDPGILKIMRQVWWANMLMHMEEHIFWSKTGSATTSKMESRIEVIKDRGNQGKR